MKYCIAGQLIEICSDIPERIANLLQGFGNFVTSSDSGEALLQFRMHSSPLENDLLLKWEDYKIIHTFNLEDHLCNFLRNGKRFLFTISDESGRCPMYLTMELGSSVVKCCYDPEHWKEGLPNPDHLKFSIWMAMAFTGIPSMLSAVHSSVIISKGKAILFLGESGTGKSTHTRLWLQHFPDCRLLNDDSPLLLIEGDKPYVCGSPWSGKGRCYLNERYPIAAVVRLNQSPFNKMEKLSKIRSIGALYPSFPPAFLKDVDFQDDVCAIISKVVSTTPVYLLHCLPDRKAAELVRDTVYCAD